MSRAVVALVGRPNVGKSSIFNRLLGRKKALVQDTPGVTRDRNYAVTELFGHEILLVDTGGFEETGVVASERMARLIREQALIAIEESDVVVFVMDIRAGLSPADEEVAARLRQGRRPVLWVLNKSDQGPKPELIAEFYRLGVDGFIPVSAEHGYGMPDLSEAIVAALPAPGEEAGTPVEPWAGEVRPARKNRRTRREEQGTSRLQLLGDDMAPVPTTSRGPEPEEWDGGEVEGREGWDPGALFEGLWMDGEGDSHPIEAPFGDGEGPDGEGDLPAEDRGFVPRMALLGRPNVGKSTLMNRLLGYQRSITSPEAGTTRDTIDACLEHEDRRYVLIDTAGVRRKARIHDDLERLTAGRAIRVIEAAHVVLLLVDASEGVTDQEAKLGALAVDRGRALVVVVNKWDLAEKGEGPREQFVDDVRRRFPHLAWADIVFLSAKTGRGVHKLWDAIARADAGHRTRVRTTLLNRWLRPLVAKTPPPMDHHHPIRIYYASQLGIRPPTFAIFCSKPEGLTSSWKRFVERELRAAFPAPGSPVRLFFRSREGAATREG